MKTIFKDNTLAQEFLEQGYVVIKFLDGDTIQLLKQKYLQFKGDFNQSPLLICASTDLNKPQVVRDIDRTVREATRTSTEKYFCDHRYILGNFLVKKPGNESTVLPHQDWTFVDESRYLSLSIWCPLDDVNEQNGNLQVLPGSHRFIPTLRPAPSFPSAFGKVQDLLTQYLIDIPLKAGEAVVFGHALIHASPPNKSSSERVSMVLGLIPAEAELLHYWYAPETQREKIEVFTMDDDFFANHVRGKKPENGSKGFLEHQFTFIETDDFINRADKHYTGITTPRTANV